MKTVVMIVNQDAFELELDDNSAAKEFRAMLPLEIDMDDVNGNEKFALLNRHLTRADHSAGQIKEGQVKLWLGNGLVVFYEDFSSSYAYTDLGYLKDVNGLKDSLGTNRVRVRFKEKKENER